MPVQPNRRIQYGQIDRWALSGATLARHRLAHQVGADRLAAAMGVSIHRIEQLERQARTTRATVSRYLAALDEAWPNPAPPMTAEQIQAREERWAAERQRERERYQAKHEARDQEHEHRDRWYAFVRAFKAGAVAAFVDHCLEPAGEVQADAVGEGIADMYAHLAREHHVRAGVADLVRELEARGLLVRAGSVEVLVPVRDRPVRGRRPGPPRMETGRRPAFEVHCRLTDFGKRLAQAQEAMPGAV